MSSLLSMYEKVRADPQLTGSVRMEDKRKIEDGIIHRAKDAMLAILEQVHVESEELDERTAEMHHVNSSFIYLSFNSQPWLSTADKVRLLEWKIRLDLVQYAARGCPAVSLRNIAAYVPKQPSEESVREIGMRLYDFGDDGHAIKQARATAVCHELMATYKDKPWAVLKDDSIWKKIQHMVVDAVEGPGVLYVRSTGFDEAWKDIPGQGSPKRSPEPPRALQTGSGSSPEALKPYSQ
ncbi:hypothetical protein CEP53_008879 [Fusarium sp. AF-6]|nr:hypothetical protein CEP53_008879 [Fusarium sp. AF-6]